MTRLIRRVMGALSLDVGTFEEIEADRGALPQALLVVVLAGIGAGIGIAGVGDTAPRVIAVVAAGSVLAWLAWAVVVHQVGAHLLPEPGTVVDLGQVLRTLGFAAAPGMFRAFEVFGATRWLFFPLTALWMVAAMTVAIRQAFDYGSIGRAIAVSLLGWTVLVAVGAGIGLWLSEPVS
ncbi:MAG: hypothetical protein AB7U83_22635 [Vicinamibacterales bacterium]